MNFGLLQTELSFAFVLIYPARLYMFHLQLSILHIFVLLYIFLNIRSFVIISTDVDIYSAVSSICHYQFFISKQQIGVSTVSLVNIVLTFLTSILVAFFVCFINIVETGLLSLLQPPKWRIMFLSVIFSKLISVITIFCCNQNVRITISSRYLLTPLLARAHTQLCHKSPSFMKDTYLTQTFVQMIPPSLGHKYIFATPT